MLQWGTLFRKPIPVPKPVRMPPGTTRIVQVSCGRKHTLALSGVFPLLLLLARWRLTPPPCADTGDVLSWGYGALGRLGHGREASVDNPTSIVALQLLARRGEHVVCVAAGGAHSGVITGVCPPCRNHCSPQLTA